jgi:hypothetical protein
VSAKRLAALVLLALLVMLAGFITGVVLARIAPPGGHPPPDPNAPTSSRGLLSRYV